jgi:FAD/FMN-containing dehydrogenase
MSTDTGLSIDDTALEAFQSGLRGQLVKRGDEAYEEARAVYNAMIDKHPALIARCADVADVMSAVNFARDNELRLAVRGGGHNGGGLGTVDDGLVIDLSLLRGVRVDPQARTARVGGGCTWADVDHAAHAFGLATPSGTISSTGVGGLTLGGGIGHLTRKYGLTIDNLLAADMVLADGSFVTVGPDQNEDLFWAIRGGGGNFGVVTSFLFKLHPLSMVYAGPMLWHLEQAKEVMAWYRDFIVEAPEDITGFFIFLNVPPGPPFPEELHHKSMAGIVWNHTGPLDQAEAAYESIRKAVPPAFEHVGPAPFPAIQTMFDPLMPPGLQWYWRADFFKELSDAAIDIHLEHASKIPTPLSQMHFYPVNGAVHRVGEDETAYSYRDAVWSAVYAGIDPDPANAEAIKTWSVNYFDGLHPHSSGGAYVNFMMEEGQERVEATYRGNYERLATVKAKYDPDNLFSVNQNIRPKA